ncbi:hypothetical protein NQ318_019991 [Aromia moschata]|uniref:Uncharacterized protein n=1 Tax=Aromia moschata TaxID=1265417 RepID=A0AAV8Y5C9_9CUCU|nr:hypothetical protein NQ318_019991 [Aromia moschata]
MFSISKLIVIMCLPAVDYLQCTENMPKSAEAKKRTVRNKLLTALSILNFVQWGIYMWTCNIYYERDTLLLPIASCEQPPSLS